MYCKSHAKCIVIVVILTDTQAGVISAMFVICMCHCSDVVDSSVLFSYIDQVVWNTSFLFYFIFIINAPPIQSLQSNLRIELECTHINRIERERCSHHNYCDMRCINRNLPYISVRLRKQRYCGRRGVNEQSGKLPVARLVKRLGRQANDDKARYADGISQSSALFRLLPLPLPLLWQRLFLVKDTS